MGEIHTGRGAEIKDGRRKKRKGIKSNEVTSGERIEPGQPSTLDKSIGTALLTGVINELYEGNYCSKKELREGPCLYQKSNRTSWNLNCESNISADI